MPLYCTHFVSFVMIANIIFMLIRVIKHAQAFFLPILANIRNLRKDHKKYTSITKPNTTKNPFVLKTPSYF